jgi:phage shock protein E
MDGNILVYILAAAVVLWLAAPRLLGRRAPPALVAAKLAAGALVVDVRTAGEFAAGAYPKAKNIPVDQLPARLGGLPKDKSIVVYCASGARSARAAGLLKRAGFADVVDAGGLANLPR